MGCEKQIWTIGHSTRTLTAFVEILNSFKIKRVVDIRSLPGSNKFSQFNQEALEYSLDKRGIAYTYLKHLGGRRAPKAHSKNTIWRNKSFQGYADYMETTSFEEGLQALQFLAEECRTAYMCAEAVWWRCHRSMISDALKVKGWRVMHIMGEKKATEHPYTTPAHIVAGKLSYQSKE